MRESMQTDGEGGRTAHSLQDAALYESKYAACLSRAMTAVRVFVSAELDAAVADVRSRQATLAADAAVTKQRR